MKTKLAMLGMIAIASGCTEPNGTYGKAYCDDTGCFKCDDELCMALDNERCAEDSQCAPGETCTTIGCAAPCAAGTCDADDLCIDGFCVPKGFPRVKPIDAVVACADDGACPEGEICGESGVCVPRCQSDDQCGPGMVCVPCGKCQPEEAPATCGTLPAFCSAEQACGGGKQCLGNRCHFECDAAQAEPCPVGQVCAEGLCKDDPAPAEAQCALDIHCGAGTCINGYCHATCKTSGDCPGFGSLCQMGACQPDYNPVN